MAGFPGYDFFATWIILKHLFFFLSYQLYCKRNGDSDANASTMVMGYTCFAMQLRGREFSYVARKTPDQTVNLYLDIDHL